MKTLNTQTNENEELPDSRLRLRTVRWSDLESVAQLIYDVCAADGDTTVAVTPEELKHQWQTPGFDPERDAFLVETDYGRVVGYEEFFNEHEHAILQTDGYVHPDYTGRGIGTSLLGIVEERAREEMRLANPAARVVLHSTTHQRDTAGHQLHANKGYQPIRYHWRMEIVLQSPPRLPRLPAGIELRPFIRGEHDVAVWLAQNESFRNHWGSHEVSFEEWQRSRFEDPEFDPTLWAVAWDSRSAEVAAISLNRYRMGIGWIRTLGVRRPWRKQGLGEALLLHSFGEFYRRGTKTVGLGVDAQNPSGATRLYHKVGMHTASEFVTFEKELRPGRESEAET